MHTPETLAAPAAVNTLGRVRHTDRDTSHQAASKLTNGKLRASQRMIYDLLVHLGPMTDDELRNEIQATGLRASKSGPASRRHELELAGWVKPVLDDEGRTVKRLSDLGGNMTVWRPVPEDEWVEPTPRPAPAPAAPAHDHEAGMAAARRLALWEIGDASWGGQIIGAYLNPEATNAYLDGEGA